MDVSFVLGGEIYLGLGKRLISMDGRAIVDALSSPIPWRKSSSGKVRWAAETSQASVRVRDLFSLSHSTDLRLS